MKTLVIKSSEWLRGTGDGQLFDGERYCCLGLACRLDGLDDVWLLDKGDPDELVGDDRRLLAPGWMVNLTEEEEMKTRNYTSTDDVLRAIEINDDSETTDEEKIRELRPVFERNNIKLDWRPNE